MTIKNIDFEGLADGTTLTGDNTGFTDILGAASMKASTVNPADGAVGARVEFTANSQAAQFRWLVPESSTTNLSTVFKRRRDTALQATPQILRFYVGATKMVALRPVPDGRMTITVNEVVVWTSTGTLPTGAHVRHSLWASIGATATTGTVEYAAYLDNSTTPITGLSWTPGATVSLGTAPFTEIQAGRPGAASDVGVEIFDSFRLKTGTDAPAFDSAPWAAPSTAVITATKTAAVRPGESVGLVLSGGTTSALTQTAGKTVTVVGTGTARTFAAPYTLGGDTLTFAHTVTGNATPATVSVAVIPAARRMKVNGVTLPTLRRVPAIVDHGDGPDPTVLLAVAGLTAEQVTGTRQVLLKWGDPNNPKAASYTVSENLHGNLNTSVTVPSRQSTDLEPGDYRYSVTPVSATGATGPAATVLITVVALTGAPTVTPGTPTIGTQTWSVTQTASTPVTALGELRLVPGGPVVATYTLSTAGTSFTEAYTGLQPGTQYIRTATFTRADTGVSATQSGAFTTQQATATVKYERLGPALATDDALIPAGWADWDKIRVLSPTTYTVNNGTTKSYTGKITIGAGRSAVVLLPRDIAIGNRAGGFTIENGVDVAVRGGEISRDNTWTTDQYYELDNVRRNQGQRLGMQLLNFTGHCDVEGVYIHGDQLLDCLWINTNANKYATSTTTKRYFTLQNCWLTESHHPTLESQTGLGSWSDNILHADGLMLVGGEPTQPDGTTIPGRTVLRVANSIVDGNLQGIITSTYGYGIEIELGENVHINLTNFNSDGTRNAEYPIFAGASSPVRVGPNVTVRHHKSFVSPGYPHGAQWTGITMTTGERVDPSWRAAKWVGTKTPGRTYIAD